MVRAAHPASAPMQGPGLKPLAEILRALGRELAELGRLAYDLQVTLSPCGQGCAETHQMLESMQMLDPLTQRLQGMADFLGALAPGLPVDWMCDPTAATRILTLADLAHRLGCPMSDSAPLENGEAGVLDLFETEGGL